MNTRARKRPPVAPTTAASGARLAVLRLLAAGDAVHPGTGRQLRRGTLLGGGWVQPVEHDVTTLGRGLHNTVVLVDPLVSRDHAQLRSTDTGWWVENTSRQNTLAAGARELAPGQAAPLVPGDILRLGDTALQLLAPAAASPGTPPPAPQSPAMQPTDASGTHLLGPGITLQFALSGRGNPRTYWAIGLLAAVVLLLCAAVTFGTITLIGHDALAAGGLRQILAALTIPLVPALGVSLLVGVFDRYEREPWFLLLGAFLWGAVIAIPPALLVERGVTAALMASAGGSGTLAHAALQALSAGITEEIFKGTGLVLLILALRDEFDNVTDGVLYGLLIGAGFAMVENYVYFALSPRGDVPSLIAGRVVLGWLSHSTFTALLGAGLGYAREVRSHRTRWLAPLLGLLAAIALHTYFDFIAFAASALSHTSAAWQALPAFSLVTVLTAYLPLFATEAVLLRLLLASLRREAEIVREYLASEVVGGALTPDEFVVLQDATLRGPTEHAILFGYGPRAYLTARALHQTATGLAFRKWHVAMGDPAKQTEKQPEDAYRLRIAKLRRSLLRRLAAQTS